MKKEYVLLIIVLILAVIGLFVFQPSFSADVQTGPSQPSGSIFLPPSQTRGGGTPGIPPIQEGDLLFQDCCVGDPDATRMCKTCQEVCLIDGQNPPCGGTFQCLPDPRLKPCDCVECDCVQMQCCNGIIFDPDKDKKRCCGDNLISNAACCSYEILCEFPDENPRMTTECFSSDGTGCKITMSPLKASCLGLNCNVTYSREDILARSQLPPSKDCQCGLVHEASHITDCENGLLAYYQRVCKLEGKAYEKGKSCLEDALTRCSSEEECIEINNSLAESTALSSMQTCICENTINKLDHVPFELCDQCMDGMDSEDLEPLKRAACEAYCKIQGKDPTPSYCINFPA